MHLFIVALMPALGSNAAALSILQPRAISNLGTSSAMAMTSCEVKAIIENEISICSSIFHPVAWSVAVFYLFDGSPRPYNRPLASHRKKCANTEVIARREGSFDRSARYENKRRAQHVGYTQLSPRFRRASENSEIITHPSFLLAI